MPIIVNRGGPGNEHIDLSSCAGGPDWEAVRTFLELARCGSIRSAADRMGLSPNALRRKIDELERTLGTVLVTRHVDGIRPTPEGAEILLAAKRWRKQPSVGEGAVGRSRTSGRSAARNDRRSHLRLGRGGGIPARLSAACRSPHVRDAKRGRLGR